MLGLYFDSMPTAKRIFFFPGFSTQTINHPLLTVNQPAGKFLDQRFFQ